MIIIAGALYVDPAERGEYLAATFRVAAQARGFAGCLDFVQSPDPIDPSRINIYERWEIDGDLDAFRASGSPGEGMRLPDIVSADVQRYRISDVEPA